MATFNITDIHKITDRGHVLTGAIAGNGMVLSGDRIVFKKGFEVQLFKITGIAPLFDRNRFSVLISSGDYEKISDWDIKGNDFKVVNLADRKQLTGSPITWTGDLSDDCTAEWAGLLLRAEWMDEEYWWWEVTDIENPEISVDSSNNYDGSVIGGEAARQKAEDAARKYLNV